MYLNYSQQTEESILKQYEQPARNDVDAMLALEAVAKKEKLEITDEELREHIEQVNERSGAKYPVDELMEKMTKERRKELVGELLSRKAMEFIIEKAVEVEPDAISAKVPVE